MDLAGLRALVNQAVVTTTVTGTKFIGKLELIADNASIVRQARVRARSAPARLS
jgi:hypothetical protein